MNGQFVFILRIEPYDIIKLIDIDIDKSKISSLFRNKKRAYNVRRVNCTNWELVVLRIPVRGYKTAIFGFLLPGDDEIRQLYR